MRLLILAIGKLRAGPEQQLVLDYMERSAKLGRALGLSSLRLVEIQESRAASESERRREEADRLIDKLPPRSFAIVLDERGKELTSEAFAGQLRRLIDGSVSDLAFLIGGADGHGPQVASRADLQLSLGKMTWPHRLVRPMLTEQIYRAVTILANHPYHRA
jgi:23S rRNA (pseudouridine1915-N3)-methyltransferase